MVGWGRGRRCCSTNQEVCWYVFLKFSRKRDERADHTVNIELSFSSLSLFGYDNGNIELGLESYQPVACLLTSIGYSKRVQIQTQRHHHRQTHQHNSIRTIAQRNCIQLLLFLRVYHMSCICYFVQALQSMKQIIHNFISSVGSTTGVVASIMVAPEFKQIAYTTRKPKIFLKLIQVEPICLCNLIYELTDSSQC